MTMKETRGPVIESLTDIDPARNAARALRDQILESLEQYHKEFQHNLLEDFPTQFIEVPVQNRSQYSLVHPSIPMILVHDPRIIEKEGFSKFLAVQEGAHAPHITIYRNTINQAAA